MEKIQDIRIMQLVGIGGNSGDGRRKNATDEVIDSALRYRVQAPLVDSLLADIGIDGGNLSKMGGLIREARDLSSIAKQDSPSSPREGGTEGGSPGEPGKTGPDDNGGPGKPPPRRRRSSRSSKS